MCLSSHNLPIIAVNLRDDPHDDIGPEPFDLACLPREGPSTDSPSATGLFMTPTLCPDSRSALVPRFSHIFRTEPD